MSGGRFSQLLLEGLDHYRKGRMLEAVRSWEEAYLLEPTNLRAREFLRSALERIHAHMPRASPDSPLPPLPAHPWLPSATPPAAATPSATTQPGPAPQPTFRPPEPPPAWPPPPLETAQPQPKAQGQAAASGDPWSDGPSIAIPHPEQKSAHSGVAVAGAWSIHKEPLPMAAVADSEVEVWMRGARELVALNDFSGAVELLGKVLGRNPNDKEALSLHDSCEQNLTQMYESKIGDMRATPGVAIPPDEIIWLNLDPRAGFVLAQIDGEVSFEDLYAICGLKRVDTARILSQLLDEGVVKVTGGKDKPKRATARR